MEVDLLRNYPKPNRRLERPRTEEDREIARWFGKEFFDGDRQHGYGGYKYDPKYWSRVVRDFINHFGLTSGDSVLDVGCAKGFMLHEFMQALPGLHVHGIDVSDYAIENAMPHMKSRLSLASADFLPFATDSFDVVISINTIHNLEIDSVREAIYEIERVKKRGSFIVVDAYRTEGEKRRMEEWNLTARTIMHVVDWEALFKECEYTGDWYWTFP